MTHSVLTEQAQRFSKAVPVIRPGFTVRVHERIQEGGKERVQIFEGLVISTHKGHVPTDASITVRKIVSGIGVEKVFPLYSPVIEKIEVKKVAKVRRAKLFFLRGRSGKSARMTERFTTEGEFRPEELAVPQEGEVQTVEAQTDNAPEAPAEKPVSDETTAEPVAHEPEEAAKEESGEEEKK